MDNSTCDTWLPVCPQLSPPLQCINPKCTHFPTDDERKFHLLSFYVLPLALIQSFWLAYICCIQHTAYGMYSYVCTRVFPNASLLSMRCYDCTNKRKIAKIVKWFWEGLHLFILLMCFAATRFVVSSILHWREDKRLNVVREKILYQRPWQI